MFRRGLSDSPLCPHPPCRVANIRETRDHALLDCSEFDHIRELINRTLRLTPSIGHDMTSEEALGAIEHYRHSDRRRILQLTGRLIRVIDRHRHL
jgi:hypothetical protein